ncbi:MAG: globin domain-containing protein [bacterium]|nr:globin domain-containing protein [bacterium]
MTQTDNVIRESVERIRKNIDRFAGTFYQTLYEKAPDLRRLFTSPELERRKLGAMLATLSHIRDWEKIEPAIRKLGERHVGYGVQVEHYPSLKEAFLAAVEAVDAEQSRHSFPAWQTLLALVIATMTERLTTPKLPPVLLSELLAPVLPAGTHTLFAEVGGYDVVERVHQRFYDSIFAEAWLGGFFATKSQQSLVLKQTRFMVAAFGGPDEYRWESPALAHMHMMVTDEQADIREILLRNAIRAEGLSQDIEDRWLATDQAFRPAIVKQSDAECVIRCPGQMAVVVKKPIGYRPPVLLARCTAGEDVLAV